MLPIHKQEIFDLQSDDDLLSFMFSQSIPDLTTDLTPSDASVRNIPPKPHVPIQTLQSLKTEAEALNITPDELKSMKLRELQAISLIELPTRQHTKNNTSTTTSSTTTETPSTITTDENSNDINTDKPNNIPDVTELPQFKQAESILSNIILKYPSYPSVYNNRAQLNQLLALYISQYPQHFEYLTQTPLTNGDAQILKKIKFIQLQALSDLNQSIQLCHQLYPLFSPEGANDLLKLKDEEEKEIAILETQHQIDHPNEEFIPPPTTLIVPRVLIQSLCQRAIIHKLRGNELLSFQDFKQASLLGSTMAQEELNNMNTIELLNRSTVFQMMKQQCEEFQSTRQDYKNQIQDAIQ